MTEEKFTPGSWHVRNNGPHWNNPSITNYDIAYSECGELVAEHVYEESDAHLIAAAPDLYEALEEAREFLVHLNVTGSLIDQIDEALAKALGE